MTENMKIQGPIEIKGNSVERVAFDLMMIVSNNENNYPKADCAAKKDSNRLYYLTLYKECLAAVKYGTVPQSDSSLG